MTTKKEYAYDFVEHDNDGVACAVSATIRASSNEEIMTAIEAIKSDKFAVTNEKLFTVDHTEIPIPEDRRDYEVKYEVTPNRGKAFNDSEKYLGITMKNLVKHVKERLSAYRPDTVICCMKVHEIKYDPVILHTELAHWR